MNVIVCIKRVPLVGAKIALTEDEQDIDGRFLGFGVSPHEECAVEEAVRIVKAADEGHSTVITLGSDAAIEQLRYALAMGINEAVLLETDGKAWEPIPTAKAITSAVQQRSFDVLLFGNESADTGGYQVGIRVAHALGLPIVAGIKSLEFEDGKAIAKRDTGKGWEIFEVDLPAVFTVKEGINLPSYPSVPGRLRAKKKPIEQISAEPSDGGMPRLRYKTPPSDGTEVKILGNGPSAAAAVVDVLEELELLS